MRKERYKLTYFEKESNSCVRKIKEMTFKTLKEAESYFELVDPDDDPVLKDLVNNKIIRSHRED